MSNTISQNKGEEQLANACPFGSTSCSTADTLDFKSVVNAMDEDAFRLSPSPVDKPSTNEAQAGDNVLTADVHDQGAPEETKIEVSITHFPSLPFSTDKT